MISHSHHVKSNKKWVSSRSSPNFILAQCLYVGNASGVKACGLRTSEAGDWNSNSDWTLTPVLDCHFKVWGVLLQIPPCWEGRPFALLVQLLGVMTLGACGSCHYEELTRTSCYWAGFGLWELLPHGTWFLFPGCVLSHFSHIQLFVTPRTVDCWLLCPWDSPGKNTGVGCHALLQGTFSTQASTQVSYVSCPASEFFTAELLGSPSLSCCCCCCCC